MSSAVINSTLETWRVITTWDTEVPEEVLKAIQAEAENTKGYVYKLEWGDFLFYHGEEGWCLDEETLKVAEEWLEENRKHHHLGEQSCFRFKIGIS